MLTPDHLSPYEVEPQQIKFVPKEDWVRPDGELFWKTEAQQDTLIRILAGDHHWLVTDWGIVWLILEKAWSSKIKTELWQMSRQDELGERNMWLVTEQWRRLAVALSRTGETSVTVVSAAHSTLILMNDAVWDQNTLFGFIASFSELT